MFLLRLLPEKRQKEAKYDVQDKEMDMIQAVVFNCEETLQYMPNYKSEY